MLVQVQGHTIGSEVCVLPRPCRAPENDFSTGSAPLPAEENIYNTAEGNSDDEMDGETEEGTYANMTPASFVQGVGFGREWIGESRKRKKTSPALDRAPDPTVGAMASMWEVVTGLRLWGETARHNVDKKKKIDLGSFNDLATSLATACAKMEAREAFLMERLSERAEVREAVVEEVEKAMKKMERFFKEKRDEDQRLRLRNQKWRFRI